MRDQDVFRKPYSHTITDARGRSMSMIDPISRYMLHRPGSIDSETLGRIVEGIEPGVCRRVRWVVPFAVGAVVLGLAALVLSIVAEGRTGWDDLLGDLTSPAFIPMIAYVLLGLPWMIIAEKRKRRRKTYAQLLRHRCCPHCGYSLKGLPVDPMDGATLCPECAGAWKLDDPTIDAICGVESSCGCPVRSEKMLLIATALLTAGALAGGLVFFMVTK